MLQKYQMTDSNPSETATNSTTIQRSLFVISYYLLSAIRYLVVFAIWYYSLFIIWYYMLKLSYLNNE